MQRDDLAELNMSLIIVLLSFVLGVLPLQDSFCTFSAEYEVPALLHYKGWLIVQTHDAKGLFFLFFAPHCYWRRLLVLNLCLVYFTVLLGYGVR